MPDALQPGKLPDPYLTKKDVAQMLQVTERTVDNYMDRGFLPYFKLGRTVRFRLKDIEAHIEEKLMHETYH